jgi:hypothetical protein
VNLGKVGLTGRQQEIIKRDGIWLPQQRENIYKQYLDRNLEAKMLRAWILTILLSMSLFSTFGYTEEGKPRKGSVTEADLAAVVNFLIDKKGKEIELAGKKHTITVKEKLDVVINVLAYCDEREFLNYCGLAKRRK